MGGGGGSTLNQFSKFHLGLNALWFVMGNLWLVKFNGLILQPMAHAKHKFPVTENGGFE